MLTMLTENTSKIILKYFIISKWNILEHLTSAFEVLSKRWRIERIFF